MSKHVIQCWSCGTRLTLDERSENDGECPECDSELALDDYFEDALTERDELRAQVQAMRVALEDAAKGILWLQASVPMSLRISKRASKDYNAAKRAALQAKP